MLSATHSDGPAFNTRSKMAQHRSPEDTAPQTDAVAPDVTLSADRLEALLQMQKT